MRRIFRSSVALYLSALLVVILVACGSGGGGGDSGQGGNYDTSTSQYVYIDALQFSGTSNYCCWTDWFYSWHTGNFVNSDGSSGSGPTYARGVPDGKYAIMKTPNPGYCIMTGTDATPQSGIKVYIASGSLGTYEVWGGNTIPTSLCSYGYPSDTCDLHELGQNPLNYGYTCLGSSSITQEFSGNYLYYIVKTGGGCQGNKSLVSISVTPANATIASGSNLQYTATGTYSDGSMQNITSFAAWTSSITSVAAISNAGMATAISTGLTTITARSGSISGSTTLIVSTNGGGGSSVWLEDWKTAPLGQRDDNEIFTSDSGKWEVDAYWWEIAGTWIGGQVSIIGGDKLLIYSYANTDLGTSSATSQGYASVEQGNYWIPLTQHSIFSGDWTFNSSVTPGAIDYDVTGAIAIGIGGRGLFRYVHENSVLADLNGFCINSPCIKVPDHFDRNLYDDMAALYGQEFLDWYNTFPYMFKMIFISVESWSVAQPYSISGDQRVSAECTLTIDDLKIWE